MPTATATAPCSPCPVRLGASRPECVGWHAAAAHTWRRVARACARVWVGGLAALALAGWAAPQSVPVPMPEPIHIPAGEFVMGSDEAEREEAYVLDAAAYGHTTTRRQQWYANEPGRAVAHTGAYVIMATPVTHRQYAAFVAATGHRAPGVARATWDAYGLIHPFERTRRHAWAGGVPPKGREDHPVVLVSRADAQAYAQWLSRQTGQHWRLPTEAEWEKAARGLDGRRFPWGDGFDPLRLNSADQGPFDTQPVGRHPTGASPFSLLDAAGQVFEWTATQEGGRPVVKGGSWDDKGCGICRPAARHTRPANLKHILIGFRLVRAP